MGKRNHVIKAVADLTGLSGFSEPAGALFEEGRPIVSVLRDYDLMKAAMTLSIAPVRTEWEVVERCRARLAGDMKEVGGFGDYDAEKDFTLYAALLDNYSQVTKAKSGERAARDKDRRERASEEQLVAYTADELNSFFATARHGNREELEAAAMPDSTRLRLTPKSAEKSAALQRFNELIKWALFSGKYEKPIAVFVVHDGKAQLCFTSPEEAGEPSVVDMDVPKGINEAEALAVHYAFALACAPDKLSALGGDDDVQQQTTAERNAKQLIVINVSDMDVFMQCMFAAEAVYSAEAREARIVANMTPFSMMGKPASLKKGYGYYVDCFAAYEALMLSNASVELGVPKDSLLAALELLGSLGGSDKVPSLDGISSDFILSVYLRTEAPKNRTALDVSMFRKFLVNRNFVYIEDECDEGATLMQRLHHKRAVYVDEDAVFRFLLAAYAFKYKADVQQRVCSKLLASEGVAITDEEALTAVNWMRDEAEVTLQRLLREYPKKVAKREKEIDEYDALAATKCFDDKALKEYMKKKPRPRQFEKPTLGFAPPESVAEIRRIVRQTVWQLNETVNAAVPNGVPDACELQGEMCVWGYKKDGTHSNNIVRFVKHEQK